MLYNSDLITYVCLRLWIYSYPRCGGGKKRNGLYSLIDGFREGLRGIHTYIFGLITLVYDS